MQDAMCLNFGALTDKELDFMLEHDITQLVPVPPILSLVSSITTS